jgi:hypothetical protein
MRNPTSGRGAGTGGGARRLVALAALAALPACYSYREVPEAALAPGSQVRAQLAPAAVVRLGSQLARPDTLLEGVFLARTAQGLEIDAYGMNWPPGTVAPPLRQRLVLAPTDVTRLEVRRLDRGTTAAAAVAGAAVAALIVARLFGIAGGGEGDDGGGGPDNSRAPVAGSLRP